MDLSSFMHLMTSRVPEKKKKKISYEKRILRSRDLFLTTVISLGILLGSQINGLSNGKDRKVCTVGSLDYQFGFSYIFYASETKHAFT